MNPELLAYAQRLGIFLDPPKPERKPRKPGVRYWKPGPRPGEGGRPRMCTHTNRRQRKDNPNITYCLTCQEAYNRKRYHEEKVA